MENKEAIENLKAATKAFNRALRVKVMEKLRVFAEIDKNAKTYRFNFENACAEEIDVGEKFADGVSEDELEYFWIEYEKEGHKMRFAFFFKDVDTNSHNVHVVPGLFEEYEHKDNHPTDMPYVIIDSETQKVVIKNASGYYPFFAEQDADGGWWCPSGKNRFVPLKPEKVGNFCPVEEAEIETISDFRTVYKNFAECEICASNELARELNKVINDNLHETIRMRYGNRTERYTPVCWYDFQKTAYSLHFTKPVYFKNYGFFTQYNIINFSKEEEKVKDIITNYPIVQEPADYKSIKARSLFNELCSEDHKKLKDDFNNFLNETAPGKED